MKTTKTTMECTKYYGIYISREDDGTWSICDDNGGYELHATRPTEADVDLYREALLSY